MTSLAGRLQTAVNNAIGRTDTAIERLVREAEQPLLLPSIQEIAEAVWDSGGAISTVVKWIEVQISIPLHLR